LRKKRLGDSVQCAHQPAAFGKNRKKDLHEVEEEIDHVVAGLWGLKDKELKDIQAPPKEIS